MTQLSEFGKTVRIKLIELNKSQAWLIEEVSRKTGLYFDTSYMHKIQTGKKCTPKIVEAIKEILEIR